MPFRKIIYALAATWALLFLSSFFVLTFFGDDGDAMAALSQLASFMTWQGAAFVVAAVAAALTRSAAERRVEGIKLVGYLPLAVSLFVLGSLVAIIAYRVYVEPLLPDA